MREGPILAILGRSGRLRKRRVRRRLGDQRQSFTTGRKFLTVCRNATEGPCCCDRARLPRLCPLPIPSAISRRSAVAMLGGLTETFVFVMFGRSKVGSALSPSWEGRLHPDRAGP